MFESFQEYEDTPREIFWFERVWLAALAVSALIAIGMYDYTVILIGPYHAAIANVLLFAIAILLMLYTSRRRSNIARWLLAIPFTLLIAFYDLSHFLVMTGRFPIAYLSIVRIGLMVTAAYLLFTPNARAWFANRNNSGD